MKAPEQAKIVYSGKIFKIYEWEQELFDGTTSTFEVCKMPYGASIIPIIDGKIAIANQTQPWKGQYYSLFGGMMEENEDFLSGAKRELLEESGCMSNDWVVFNTHEEGSNIDQQRVIYIARNCQKISETNMDSGEKIEMVLLDFDEFLDVVLLGMLDGNKVKFRGQLLKMKLMEMKLAGELEDFKHLLFQ